jgi:multidrug efflux system outer membrane protein
VLLLIASGTVASCTVGPDYQPPSISLESSYAFAPGQALVAASTEEWWKAYRDPMLDALVTRGLSQNLDIRTAQERIRQARAVYRGTLLPAQASGDLTGKAVQTTSDGRTAETDSAELDAEFALDLFGGYRRGRQQARADLEATTFDLGTTRLAFLSELIGAYVDARYFQAAIAYTNLSIGNRRKTLNLAAELVAGGGASEVERVRAEAELDLALADLPQLRSGFDASAFRIATLLAMPSNEVLRKMSPGAPQPSVHDAVRAGIPAELLRNRPDVIAAERRLAARTAAIGVAEADLYPSVSLLGVITLSGGADATEFGPRLTLPIFHRGTLLSRRDAAISQARQAELDWRNAVLKAVEDVQSGLSRVRNGRQQVAAFEKAAATYTRVGALARERFDFGEATLLELLDTEQDISSTNLSLAQARRVYATSYAQLCVAIGKGWRFGAEDGAAAVAVAAKAP